MKFFSRLLFLLLLMLSSGCFNDDVAELALGKLKYSFTLSYNGNGNTSGAVPDSLLYTSGANITIPDNTGNLMKINAYNSAEGQNASFRFAGWNTLPDGNGTDYTPGMDITISSDLTLYAKWIPYALRDSGPAGGLIFYDKGTYSNGWRYLEAALVDLSSSPWSEAVAPIADAIYTGAGDGKNNTEAIINMFSFEVTAAANCKAYSINGYNDWYLPSVDELKYMCEELYLYGCDAFTGVEYWSSTQDNSIEPNAYTWNFSTNEGTSYTKNLQYSLRPARQF